VGADNARQSSAQPTCCRWQQARSEHDALLPVAAHDKRLQATEFHPRTQRLVLVEYVGFEVLTAVTMKNGVFWDTNTPFVPHRTHITSPLQSPAG
jgi:hypothetical protein